MYVGSYIFTGQTTPVSAYALSGGVLLFYLSCSLEKWLVVDTRC